MKKAFFSHCHMKGHCCKSSSGTSVGAFGGLVLVRYGGPMGPHRAARLQRPLQSAASAQMAVFTAAAPDAGTAPSHSKWCCWVNSRLAGWQAGVGLLPPPPSSPSRAGWHSKGVKDEGTCIISPQEKLKERERKREGALVAEVREQLCSCNIANIHTTLSLSIACYVGGTRSCIWHKINIILHWWHNKNKTQHFHCTSHMFSIVIQLKPNLKLYTRRWCC